MLNLALRSIPTDPLPAHPFAIQFGVGRLLQNSGAYLSALARRHCRRRTRVLPYYAPEFPKLANVLSVHRVQTARPVGYWVREPSAGSPSFEFFHCENGTKTIQHEPVQESALTLQFLQPIANGFLCHLSNLLFG